ncbi:13167_t:CDS:2 [Ambispora gerdemannii]|uniref:Ataxin-3 homolog n=1 Tax=Ambispora gerdemannii TaxID=144530 RepID=A0A9N8ZSX1_9GLOM|nr:13167_t:CDS:2 [Ambispora gerdemannii]
MSDLIPYLFWEKQEGQLCAQHCLNSLLQGELFTAVDLSVIARTLDQAEQAALQEGALPGQVIPNPSIKSQNMDDSGFFSVQVLSEALKIIPIGSEQCEGVRGHPDDEIAYICNLHEHWFCLRKFGGTPTRWYNLDSLLRGPEWISQTYLGMLLSQLENDGYNIFVVRGTLPISQADEYAAEHPEPLGRTKEKSHDDIDAAMIEAAIAASLENNSSSSSPISNNNQQDSEKSNETSIDEIRAKRLARFG